MIDYNVSWCNGNTQVFGAYVSGSNPLETTLISSCFRVHNINMFLIN